MKTYKVELNEGSVLLFNAAFYYFFLKKLVTPFEKTKAFELGIIDQNGKNLIPRSEFNTLEQKRAYTKFDVLVFNLKKLLAKVPGGRSKIATFGAALWLLKEDKKCDCSNSCCDRSQFIEFLKQIQDNEESENFFSDLEKELNQEDVAANSVAGGGVAMYSPVLRLVSRKQKKFKDFT